MAAYSSEPSTSLATACPSCATVFRVVQDQLKVSQGWVRCGRCHEVFNALEGLFDLDSRRGGETGSPSGFSATGPTSQSGATSQPGGGPQRGNAGATSAAATPPGDWDETSPAMFSGNRTPNASRMPAEAPGAGAALLRERLAARVAAANAAAGGHPGAGHDEVEQDTRFEPKFFENGPPTPLPDDISASMQSPTRPGDIAAERAVDRSMAARAGAGSVDVDVDMDVSAGRSGEVEQRREPWLTSGASPTRPAPGPSPVNDRGNQRWAEAMGEEAEETEPEFSPTEALLQLPDGPLMPAPDTSRVQSREPVMALGGALAGEATPARAAAAVLPDAAHPAVSAAGPMTQPGFLRDAERKARWQRPRVRAALLAACVVLSLTALAQLGLKNRDRYAARWPVTRPVLLELCGLVGCTLQAPRQIDALVVETSSLTRPPGVEGLRLQLVLRNRIDYEVAAPHVELSLTDAAGAIMARRVFNPGEFGMTRAALGAQQDANWSLVFSTTLRNIAGYSVSVFYP